MTTKTCPTLDFAFEVRLSVGAPRTTEANGITRRVIPILDGRFEGDGFKEIVFPGGADWQIVRPEPRRSMRDGKHSRRTATCAGSTWGFSGLSIVAGAAR